MQQISSCFVVLLPHHFQFLFRLAVLGGQTMFCFQHSFSFLLLHLVPRLRRFQRQHGFRQSLFQVVHGHVFFFVFGISFVVVVGQFVFQRFDRPYRVRQQPLRLSQLSFQVHHVLFQFSCLVRQHVGLFTKGQDLLGGIVLDIFQQNIHLQQFFALFRGDGTAGESGGNGGRTETQAIKRHTKGNG